MCKLCEYEGGVNTCPICNTQMPCNTKYRHCVCDNCLYLTIPYKNNTRVIHYNYNGKLWYKHENSDKIHKVKNDKERYCYIYDTLVYVQKGRNNQIYYQLV